MWIFGGLLYERVLLFERKPWLILNRKEKERSRMVTRELSFCIGQGSHLSLTNTNIAIMNNTLPYFVCQGVFLISCKLHCIPVTQSWGGIQHSSQEHVGKGLFLQGHRWAQKLCLDLLHSYRRTPSWFHFLNPIKIKNVLLINQGGLSAK